MTFAAVPMEFVLISDENIIFDGEVSKICFISQNGPFVIMDNHIPYISRIQNSVSFIGPDNEETVVNISDGFVYTNGISCFAVVDILSE